MPATRGWASTTERAGVPERVYFDYKPCRVCGSDVELEAREGDEPRGEKHPDGTSDRRICTNPGCPTNTDDDAPEP